MVENLTPKSMRCTYSASCPGVYQFDDGNLLIVGKRVDLMPTVVDHGLGDISIGEDEQAVLISPDLLADYVKQTKVKSDA